ncbi:hypothetical protein HK097_005357 [Rhizophlyctis rosea]|uniref:P-loop containing nucleoside triphosphate hydrolase protein n=1 Tax=Rhizophlyctis rosea TaxID=64517 RepID=A0AAD5SGS9_9FUNG|nr:hypothetical protein HK097_005357 [Rhizophlyctis rosea]
MAYIAADQLAIQLFSAFVRSFVHISIPYFLNRIIVWVQTPERDTKVGWMLVIAMFVASFAEALINGQLYWAGRRSSLRIRAVLVEEIYSKAVRRAAGLKPPSTSTEIEGANDGAASLGKIVTLMSVDVERLQSFVSYAHRLVLELPMSIVLAVGALFYVLGWSALATMAVLVLGTIMGGLVGRQIQKVQEALMAATDKRVTVTNEVLQGIRIIKYFAWEPQFIQRIIETRVKELAALKRLWVAYMSFNISSVLGSLLVTIATFGFYTGVAGHKLDPQTAFTAIALLNQISMLIAFVPYHITELFQVKVSVGRILDFLAEPDLQKYDLEGGDEVVIASWEELNDSSLGFKNATFAYFGDDSAGAESPRAGSPTAVDGAGRGSSPVGDINEGVKFRLRDVDVEFKKGRLNVIAGQTGAGKSSLVLALLGEMKLLNGTYDPPNSHDHAIDPATGLSGGVAFAAQSAWLVNATVRDNILFGTPYDEERYHRVLEACALVRDIENLQGGDLTEIGEKGVNMSGGQKARISLARAAYSHASTVIMDDPLSAVDAPTAKHLLRECILGIMKGRTRILVSHAVGLVLPVADMVVAVRGGKVVGKGKPADIVKDEKLSGLFGVDLTSSESEDEADKDGDEDGGKGKAKSTLAGAKKGTKLVEDEERATGRVKGEVYWSYFAACGGVLFLIIFFGTLVLVNGMQLANDWWVKYWSEAAARAGESLTMFVVGGNGVAGRWDGFVSTVRTFGWSNLVPRSFSQHSTVLRATVAGESFSIATSEQHSPWYFISIFALLGLAVLVATTIRLIYIVLSALRAATHLHANLLGSVMGSPMRFFEVTPLGRVLNRFSKDVQSLDTTVIFAVDSLSMYVAKGLTVLGLIAFRAPYLLIGAVPLVYAYQYIASMYLQLSRELKRLESVSRSPLYSQFSETLTGVTTIRAYGAEERFLIKARQTVDGNHRAYFLLWAANRWLTIRTDLLGALVAFGAGVAVVAGDLPAGWAGLLLTYALTFADALLWIVRQHAEVEMNMNSVERIQEYTSLEQEPPMIVESHRPPVSWPQEGAVQVKDLVVRYAADSPPVLKSISFDVKPREKVGIVGRTGAGKSTLSLAFFRIVPLTSGSITIDGIDIAEIGLHDLRKNLNIIPQDPVLFSGTIRSNMDPFDENADAEIWDALKAARVVESLRNKGHDGEGGVEVEVAPSASAATVPGSVLDGVDRELLVAPEDSDRPFSLEYPVAENGNNFSQGQRQLLCLARALLKKTRVVFLDEATASVDNQTDEAIQKAMRECFGEGVVLCIAHRLRTVIDYDRILVLDHGQVVEYDTPMNLMREGGGTGHFRRMVMETGEFDELWEIAKKKEEGDAGFTG